MNYLTEMHDAIDRRQGWQFDRDMADDDPEKAARYRANELRADDDARLMALVSIAEAQTRLADNSERIAAALERIAAHMDATAAIAAIGKTDREFYG